MKDVDSALSQISSIRTQLAASTHFLGIAPGLNVLAAAIVFIVAAVQGLYPQALVENSLNYATVWAAVMVSISAAAVVEAIARARRLHGSLAYTMLHSIMQKILPFFAAGIVLTWTICKFAPESAWILPGLWQILIGLLGFSLTSNLPNGMGWVAVWFFLSGSIVLAWAGHSETLSPWMMGIPFFVGQIIVALILVRASKENGCE